MDDVPQNLDQRLSEHVSLAVKESEKVANVEIDCLRSKLGKLREKLSDILDPDRFMLGIVVEDLFGQVPNDFIRKRVVLSFCYQPNELRQRLSQVFLGIEKVNDF